MTYLGDLEPFLRVVGLFDSGVPNGERIVLEPTFRASLIGHGLAVGIDAGDAGAFPIYDNVFWFPDIIVEPPSRIFIYTGKGSTEHTKAADGVPALVFHWQRQTTVFDHPDIVPVLFQLVSATVVQKVPPLRR